MQSSNFVVPIIIDLVVHDLCLWQACCEGGKRLQNHLATLKIHESWDGPILIWLQARPFWRLSFCGTRNIIVKRPQNSLLPTCFCDFNRARRFEQERKVWIQRRTSKLEFKRKTRLKFPSIRKWALKRIASWFHMQMIFYDEHRRLPI